MKVPPARLVPEHSTPCPTRAKTRTVTAYRRPYEGTNVDTGAMQAYLDWEFGLVKQLRRLSTHGFFVI
jgi:hypothetical protein